MNNWLLNSTLLFLISVLSFLPTGRHAFALDPCPVPKVALSQTPADLARVQADIDRYALCVERAQLLQRLNDLAAENNKHLPGYTSVMNPGFTLDTASIAVKKDIFDTEESEKEPAKWQVLEIYGPLDRLQARIIKSGIVYQVVTGDRLSDGKTVAEISPFQVTVMENGSRNTLDWVE